jgi:hypothetical protein
MGKAVPGRSRYDEPVLSRGGTSLLALNPLACVAEDVSTWPVNQKWRLHEAKDRIKGTLEWRREYKPELIKESDVRVEAETGKM